MASLTIYIVNTGIKVLFTQSFKDGIEAFKTDALKMIDALRPAENFLKDLKAEERFAVNIHDSLTLFGICKNSEGCSEVLLLGAKVGTYRPHQDIKVFKINR